ncbi:uncharacterized protein [Clytia hemisphaerica]|uniref:Uncharacterized protein n=1 Tax=Clytia hemisphaerica TaxID=252671 RepID=A0A7M5XG50_9CNID|eukprot:TCONS_00017745-protein
MACCITFYSTTLTAVFMLLQLQFIDQAPLDKGIGANSELLRNGNNKQSIAISTASNNNERVKNVAFLDGGTSTTAESTSFPSESASDSDKKANKSNKVFVVARVYPHHYLEKYGKTKTSGSLRLGDKETDNSGSSDGPSIFDILNEIGNSGQGTSENTDNEISGTEPPTQTTAGETEPVPPSETSPYYTDTTETTPSFVETTPHTTETMEELNPTTIEVAETTPNSQETTPTSFETTPITTEAAQSTSQETTPNFQETKPTSFETKPITTEAAQSTSQETTPNFQETKPTSFETTPITSQTLRSTSRQSSETPTHTWSKTESTIGTKQPTISKCECPREHKDKDSKKSKHEQESNWDQFKPDFTSSTDDQKHYQLAEYISKHIFKHYPEYRIPLLAKYLSKNTEQRAYDGMVMEFQQPNNFNILVTDSYSQFNNAGRDGRNRGGYQSVEQYPSLYQCTKAIRYCSINPKYCQYQEGDYNSNIILVVPHAGSVKPETIKERSPGCLVNGQCVYLHNCGIPDSVRCPVFTQPDRNSKTLAFNVATHIKSLTGTRPHIVVMDLHRSLVDVDGSRDEGAFDDVTRSAWYDFHNFISLAKLKIQGNGLLIDLHEHKHRHGLIELSYGVEKTELSQKTNAMSESSIRSLVNRHQDASDKDLLIGPKSLGGILEKRHIETIPSPNNPEMTESGYTDRQMITKLYGSMYGGTVDAIRVSVPRKYQMGQDAKMFSQVLSESINDFVQENYADEKP